MKSFPVAIFLGSNIIHTVGSAAAVAGWVNVATASLEKALGLSTGAGSDHH
jgi:hypothetical protein